MPGTKLPLTIFEPRYIEMVQDAMKGYQLIGMIQPCDELSPPNLHKVGCVGRITQYEETNDGRLGIILSGLCRFAVLKEIPGNRKYRTVTPNWSAFANDYKPNSEPSSQTKLLFNSALRNYLKKNNIENDWQTLEKLRVSDLANSVLSYLPLSPEDKQILIEIDTLENRLVAFSAILENDKDAPVMQH